MSFNIRYDNPRDGRNSWSSRKPELLKMVRYYSPDLLGVQEALHHQVTALEETLTGHSRVGVGRDDGSEKGEFTAILYDTSTLYCLHHETFWLSETPDRVSVGWDAAMERICTYAMFRIKESGDTIHVFNTHFDHRGAEARARSALLIREKTMEFVNENHPSILMGDLNTLPGSLPLKELLHYYKDAGKLASSGIYGPSGTFNSFETEKEIKKRIDFIFTRNLEVLNYRHIDDRRKNNLHISDHLAVFAEFIF